MEGGFRSIFIGPIGPASTFGAWPSRVEYLEWARVRREAARSCGAPDPRLASEGTIMRHFGTFDRALQAAQALYRDAP